MLLNPLESQSKDKVYREAMLTIQADYRKAEIIKETYRFLKKVGLYAIHELGLKNIDKKHKSQENRIQYTNPSTDYNTPQNSDHGLS